MGNTDNINLALECIYGDTTVIDMELTDSGVPVPLTNIKAYFAVAQKAGDVPFIDYNTTDNPSNIVVVPTTGSLSIEIPRTTKWPFMRGEYAVVLLNTVTDRVVTQLAGPWLVKRTVKVVA